MIIALAGLPGAGKSTLARALSAALGGAVIDKDQVRAALFAGPWTLYSAQQDDFVLRLMLEAAEWLALQQNCPAVLIDGRTFSKAAQRETVRALARRIGRPFHLIECVCPDEVALERIRGDGAAHLAANRDAALYWSVKAAFEPIAEPHLRIDTTLDVAANVALCLASVRAPQTRGPVPE